MQIGVTTTGSVGRVYGNDFGTDAQQAELTHDPEAFTALLADEGRI